MNKTQLKKIRSLENKTLRKLNHFSYSEEYQASVCENCNKPHQFNQLAECDFLYLELTAIGMAVMVLGGHIQMNRLTNPLLIRRLKTAWTRAKERAWRDHLDKIVHIEGVCHTTSRHILNNWIQKGDSFIEELST